MSFFPFLWLYFSIVSAWASNYFNGFMKRKFTPERGFDFSKRENEDILRVVEHKG